MIFKRGVNLQITKVADTLSGIIDRQIVGTNLVEEENRDDFLYFVARAVTADAVNGNGDIFPADQLREAYSSFIGKGLYLNHDSGKVEKSVGRVIDAVLVDKDEKDVHVLCFCKIDKKLYPHIARKVITGVIDSVSMGCTCTESQCSVCSKKMYSEEDFCDHMKCLGKEINHNGKKVMVTSINRGITFTELSLVDNPADVTARVKAIYASATPSKKAQLRQVAKEAGLKIADVGNYDPAVDPDYYEKDLAKMFGKSIRILQSREEPHDWYWESIEDDVYRKGFKTFEEAKRDVIRHYRDLGVVKEENVKQKIDEKKLAEKSSKKAEEEPKLEPVLEPKPELEPKPKLEPELEPELELEKPEKEPELEEPKDLPSIIEDIKDDIKELDEAVKEKDISAIKEDIEDLKEDMKILDEQIKETVPAAEDKPEPEIEKLESEAQFVVEVEDYKRALGELEAAGWEASFLEHNKISVPAEDVDYIVALLLGKGFNVLDYRRLEAKKGQSLFLEKKASAFDKVEKIDVTDKMFATKDKETGNIVVKDLEGKEIISLPDAFGEDIVPIIKLLQMIVELKADKEKVNLVEEDRDAARVELAEFKASVELGNKIARCRNIIEEMISKDMLMLDEAFVKKSLEKGMSPADVREAAIKNAADKQLADMLKQDDDQIEIFAATVSRFVKTARAKTGDKLRSPFFANADLSATGSIGEALATRWSRSR